MKVAAAGINRPDVLQRAGGYPPPKGASDIPGLELSGEVVDVGPGCKTFKRGDKVMGSWPVAAMPNMPLCRKTMPAHSGRPLDDRGRSRAGNFFTVWTNVFDGQA